MSDRKALEDFQLDMVDKFLSATEEDITDMRRMIKNLKLFDTNTPARLAARTLLLEELASLQTDLSAILAGLVKTNTKDTIALLGDRELKAESEQLVAALQTGVIPEKKSEVN